MTTTFTNRGYAEQGTGDNPNAWGATLNANFAIIDNNISSLTSISTTGGTRTLTSTQAQALVYSINGALTSQATIVFPFQSMFFLVYDNTTGNHPVVIKAAGGGTTVTTSAYSSVFYSDGTNITAVNPVLPAATFGNYKVNTTNAGSVSCGGTITMPYNGIVSIHGTSGGSGGLTSTTFVQTGGTNIYSVGNDASTLGVIDAYFSAASGATVTMSMSATFSPNAAIANCGFMYRIDPQ